MESMTAGPLASPLVQGPCMKFGSIFDIAGGIKELVNKEREK